MNMQINQKGQSLLEIAVLIGVIIIVVVGMVSTIIYGLKNSQLSKNSVQATKYAQEGLEIMRTAKARNCPVTQVATTFRWSAPEGSEQSIWNLPVGPNYVSSYNLDSCSLQLGAPPTTPIDSEGLFVRKIMIERIVVVNQLKISSKVIWTDPSGTHESNIVTIFANY